MYFYFFCEYPAVIKFQGIIFGTVNNSVKFCDLDKPYPLVEICPLMGKGENVAFYPADDFLDLPPRGVTVTDLKGGYFLRFSKSDNADGFSILAQEKYRDATITAFRENGYKISMETQTGFFAETLAFAPKTADFTHGEGVNSDLIFSVFDCGNKKILNVYGINERTLLFSKEVDGFEVTATGFTTTEKLRDMAKHTIMREYSFKGNSITETSRKVTASEKFDREKLPEKLVPYAFSEEFLCGGDYAFYLADGIKENADKLGGFFGEFLGVTPPPLFRDYREIGFIRKIAEGKYSVDYFTFSVVNGKIENINKA